MLVVHGETSGVGFAAVPAAFERNRRSAGNDQLHAPQFRLMHGRNIGELGKNPPINRHHPGRAHIS